MEKIFSKVLLAFFLVIGISFPLVSLGEKLYFAPSLGSYTIGKTFSVRVFVASPSGQSINAVSGVVKFPPEKLELISLSKSESIVSLWVQEPTFSNTSGSAQFEGVILNPGFAGSAGKVITLNFKVVGSGDTALSFSSGAVLANDGNGTNVLKILDTASFLLGIGNSPAISPEAVPEIRKNSGIAVPSIKSSTHPDSQKWYNAKEAKFSWTLPSEVLEVLTLVDKIPNSKPSKRYDPPIHLKDISDPEQGAWYFHVQFKTDDGLGPIAHFRFNTDTEKPESFSIKEISRTDPTEPVSKFTFLATDSISGINHYEIDIDGKLHSEWRDDGSGIYATPVLGPGKHTLLAKAVDEAGNFLVSSADFSIQGIKAPQPLEYPEEIKGDEPLIVRGTTEPSYQVNLYLEDSEGRVESQSTKSDEAGRFTLAWNTKLTGGLYFMWLEAEDLRGAKSEFTIKHPLVVKQPFWVNLGARTSHFLAIAVPVISLLALLLLVLFSAWHKLRKMKKRLASEIKEAEVVVHRSFEVLRKDLQKHVKLLEKASLKRRLTREEEKIMNHLKENLDNAEDVILDEVLYVEKQIEEK